MWLETFVADCDGLERGSTKLTGSVGNDKIGRAELVSLFPQNSPAIKPAPIRETAAVQVKIERHVKAKLVMVRVRM